MERNGTTQSVVSYPDPTLSRARERVWWISSYRAIPWADSAVLISGAPIRTRLCSKIHNNHVTSYGSRPLALALALWPILVVLRLLFFFFFFFFTPRACARGQVIGSVCRRLVWRGRPSQEERGSGQTPIPRSYIRNAIRHSSVGDV